MKKLKKQGFYREMPYGEKNGPSIKDNVFKANYGDEKEKIIAYLNNGVAFIVCCGICDDVINPENKVPQYPSILTDGEWAWTADLAYYVEKYNLQLEAQFVENIRKNHWKIDSSKIGINDLELE